MLVTAWNKQGWWFNQRGLPSRRADRRIESARHRPPPDGARGLRPSSRELATTMCLPLYRARELFLLLALCCRRAVASSVDSGIVVVRPAAAAAELTCCAPLCRSPYPGFLRCRREAEPVAVGTRAKLDRKGLLTDFAPKVCTTSPS